MDKLVLHHTYANGIASDISGFGNHGVVDGTRVIHQSALAFPGRVSVQPSSALTELYSIRLRIRFIVERNASASRRHMALVFAPGSFAVTITPELDIEMSVFRAATDLTGHSTRTPRGAVTRDQWHIAEVLHDGVSRARIVLDGLVAAESSVPGPIRGLGRGLIVGNTPPRHIQNMPFSGSVDDLMLWKFAPDEKASDLWDACCVDKAGLDEVLRDLTESWDAKTTNAWVREFFDRSSAAVQSDPERFDVAELERTGSALLTAIRTRDPAMYTRAVRDFAVAHRPGLRRSETAETAAFRDHLVAGPLGPELLRPVRRGEAPDMELFKKLARVFCVEPLAPKEWPTPPPAPSKERAE